MILDAAVVALLIYIFARYNAEGGLLRAFLMLLGVTVATVLVIIALPKAILWLALPIYALFLAIGLTFVCGTQPKQTGSIIGIFFAYRFTLFGIGYLFRQ